ncbi:hypothetical protein EDB83DRAFT_2354667 [Lactarius deliciosus]|nr:hypothetical protein EDB83DRAFT_2354667 [Lactarius deliciosus]
MPHPLPLLLCVDPSSSLLPYLLTKHLATPPPFATCRRIDLMNVSPNPSTPCTATNWQLFYELVWVCHICSQDRPPCHCHYRRCLANVSPV